MHRTVFILMCWSFAFFVLPAEARSRYGKLEITCEVAGAEVFIDGRRYGSLPLRKAIKKRAGTYTLRVSKPGFGDYLQSVKIKRGRLTRITAYLTELTGILKIDSTPSNAEVVINGRMYGHTPFSEALSPSQYDVELRLPGHRVYRQRVELKAGRQSKLAPLLVFAPSVEQREASPWYKNKWVWVGVGSVLLVTTVVTAVAVTADDNASTGDFPMVNISTSE